MKEALTYIEPKTIQQTVEEPLMLEFEKRKSWVHQGEKEISNKFKVLSVLAILLVVIIHSNNVIPIENDNYTFATFKYNFQYLLTQGIARIAVPIFFIISGYYFFERINKNDFLDLLSCILKEMKLIERGMGKETLQKYFFLSLELQEYKKFQLIIDIENYLNQNCA